nr:unnamed protein product [Callosobruchus chinensis]
MNKRSRQARTQKAGTSCFTVKRSKDNYRLEIQEYGRSQCFQDPVLYVIKQDVPKRALVQSRAIRLIGDPALTCHRQPLTHRRAVDDISVFYRILLLRLTSIIPHGD